MYKVQPIPTGVCYLRSGDVVFPMLTLKNERDGISHIIEEDLCYVLVMGSTNSDFFRTKFWFSEAIEALKKLPVLPQL